MLPHKLHQYGIGMKDKVSYFHNLEAKTGFGDRILDLWAVLTIVQMSDPGAKTRVFWDTDQFPLGKKPRHVGKIYDDTFDRHYSPDLFSVQGCEFVSGLIKGALQNENDSDQRELNKIAFYDINEKVRQVFLRSGIYPGSTSPEVLMRQRAFYGFPRKILLRDIVEAYRNVAAGTVMSSRIKSLLPDDIGDRVGIHIRLTDKLVEREVPWEMTPRVWKVIEARGMRVIEKCIKLNQPMLVCSDDREYKQRLVDRIRQTGGDAITIEPGGKLLKEPGTHAQADFFALASCRRIIQLTKYSTFSMAASLAGQIPLTNLSGRKRLEHHQFRFWRSAFPDLLTVEDEIGKMANYGATVTGICNHLLGR